MKKTDFAELKRVLTDDSQRYISTTELVSGSYTRLQKSEVIIKELLEILEENNKCLFYYKEIIEEQLSAGAYLRQTIDQTNTRLQKLREGK